MTTTSQDIAEALRAEQATAVYGRSPVGEQMAEYLHPLFDPKYEAAWQMWRKHLRHRLTTATGGRELWRGMARLEKDFAERDFPEYLFRLKNQMALEYGADLARHCSDLFPVDSVATSGTNAHEVSAALFTMTAEEMGRFIDQIAADILAFVVSAKVPHRAEREKASEE